MGQWYAEPNSQKEQEIFFILKRYIGSSVGVRTVHRRWFLYQLFYCEQSVTSYPTVVVPIGTVRAMQSIIHFHGLSLKLCTPCRSRMIRTVPRVGAV